MRVSCRVPVKLASSTLVENLRELGVDPVVGAETIEVVHESPNRHLGDILIELFCHEADHEICVDYSDEHSSKQVAHYGTPPRAQGFGPKLNAAAPQKG